MLASFNLHSPDTVPLHYCNGRDGLRGPWDPLTHTHLRAGGSNRSLTIHLSVCLRLTGKNIESAIY